MLTHKPATDFTVTAPQHNIKCNSHTLIYMHPEHWKAYTPLLQHTHNNFPTFCPDAAVPLIYKFEKQPSSCRDILQTAPKTLQENYVLSLPAGKGRDKGKDLGK